jgi:hypothetical protein
VFWGIVLGGVYAVLADGMLFQPYYTTVVSSDGVYTGLNIISLMLVVMVASVFSHLLLRRERVRKGGLSAIEWMGVRPCDRGDARYGHDVSNV